jgi:hypothetical protein
LANNPIASLGLDVVNSYATTLAQGLVSSVLKKTSKLTKGIDGAVNSVFTVWAMASTAQVEVLMEIARGNARLIVSQLAQKDAAIKLLQADIIKLNNAITLLVNGANFFSPYKKQLIQAYNLIKNGDTNLKSVVSTLNAVHQYRHVQYQNAVNTLVQAQALILPDRTADFNLITSGHFLQTSGVTSAKNALAAALSIPALTASIAKNFITYSALTVSIDALIVLFQTALGSFINAYTRNTNIDAVTIDHINNATRQLDSLLIDMGTQLFPTDGSDSSPIYPTKLTASATVWGVELTGIIEWLKLEPGQASKALDVTGESVRRYNLALSQLNAMNTLDPITAASTGRYRSGSAVLTVEAGSEKILDTAAQVGLVMLTANTAVASNSISVAAQQNIRSLSSLMQISLGLDSDIRNALTPFINTPNNLLNGASTVVSNMANLTKSLGLDRAASLLAKADIAGMFSVTSQTATFVGAAILGTRALLAKLESNPAATDQDKANLTNYSDEMSRTQSAKNIEATVSSTDNADLFKQQQQAKITKLKKLKAASDAVEAKQNGNPLAPTSDLATVTKIVVNYATNKFNYL